MGLIETLQEKARKNPQKVVYPECHENIIKAARKVSDLGLGYPVLVGKPDILEKTAKNAGVSLAGIGIVDQDDAKVMDRIVARYRRVNRDYPSLAVKSMLRDSLNFGAMMVKTGEACCMVAGISHNINEVVIASRMIIGMKEGINTVSSMGIASIPGFKGSQGNMLALADYAVSRAPDPGELAEIAISTADTVRQLIGWEPRVGLLSFSTKGSAGHQRVDRVLKALETARQLKPDLLIDGELQLDSAIVPEVASRKVKGKSPVAGKANILIFPDLNAGNIAVKILQTFSKAVVYGPVLQGFDRPVSGLSREASVEEIIIASTIAVARCH